VRVKDRHHGNLSSHVFPLSSLRLSLRRPDQTNPGEEKDTAHNQVNERRLRDSAFGEVDASIDQTDKADQG
jgi:hypothetical protein